jgi:hypothetical protein
LSFFNWNSNDATATTTAKIEAPPGLFLSAQNCNTLEIPQAKPAPNDNAVAKDGSLSFSNIFHDLTSQPQFNMMAAVEAKPAEQPTCIPQANETGQPAEALLNANQPSGNGDVPTLANQPGGNGDVPTIRHQSADDSIQPLTHQDGENHRLDCAKVVSEQLSQIDQRIGVTSNLSAMRNELTKNGWDQVAQDPSQFDPQQLQPGDVITGTRQPGMPGHAAIYLGGGMIYNNNSDAGTPTVESVDKFMQKQYNADGSFNKDGYSNVSIYRNPSESFRKNEMNRLLDLAE